MKHKKNCQFTPRLILHSVNLRRLKLNNYFFHFCINISRAVIIQESPYEAYEQVSLVWSPPYFLTWWSRVLLEKLTSSQLDKKFPAFYGTWRFFAPFTHARHLSFLYQFHSLFWAYQSWGIKQSLGSVTCNTEDLIVIGLICVFIEVFLTALYFRVTYCPTPSELVLHSCKCLMFLSAVGRDLGT